MTKATEYEQRLARINEIVQEAYGSGEYREALAAIESICESPLRDDRGFTATVFLARPGGGTEEVTLQHPTPQADDRG